MRTSTHRKRKAAADRFRFETALFRIKELALRPMRKLRDDDWVHERGRRLVIPCRLSEWLDSRRARDGARLYDKPRRDWS
jgi:hypothetical protein